MTDTLDAAANRGSKIRLVVGLGNPGSRYARHRHNVGFQCIDYLAQAHGGSLSKRMDMAEVGCLTLAGASLVLAKPQTFMNRSGDSVVRLMHRLHIQPANLLVVYDEMDLPLGRIRIRAGGSHGGQKGMMSVIDRLGSGEIPRIRVGIGRPNNARASWDDDAVVRWLLSDLTAQEEEIMAEMRAQTAEAIGCILKEGINTAMNRFN